MVPVSNPFTPSFGAFPPCLVGRDDMLTNFAYGLDNGPGALERSTLYAGSRGVGKTVMLRAAEAKARERGWVVITDSSREGLLENLVQTAIPEKLQLLDPDGFGKRASHPTSAKRAVSVPTIQTLLRDLCILAEQGGTGVLLSLDEIHRSSNRDIQEVTIALQHLRGEGRNLAFVGAGLTEGLDELSNDDVKSFMRRSDRWDLGNVSLHSVQVALQQPASEWGRPFTLEAVQLAADATEGHPFVIQLVGSHCFRSNYGTPQIETLDALRGIDQARQRLTALIN